MAHMDWWCSCSCSVWTIRSRSRSSNLLLWNDETITVDNNRLTRYTLYSFQYVLPFHTYHMHIYILKPKLIQTNPSYTALTHKYPSLPLLFTLTFCWVQVHIFSSCFHTHCGNPTDSILFRQLIECMFQTSLQIKQNLHGLQHIKGPFNHSFFNINLKGNRGLKVILFKHGRQFKMTGVLWNSKQMKSKWHFFRYVQFSFESFKTIWVKGFWILCIPTSFTTWISKMFFFLSKNHVLERFYLNPSSNDKLWNYLICLMYARSTYGTESNEEKRTVLCIYMCLGYGRFVKQINYKMLRNLHPIQCCLILIHNHVEFSTINPNNWMEKYHYVFCATHSLTLYRTRAHTE